MANVEFLNTWGVASVPEFCGAPCHVCFSNMTPCVIHTALGYSVRDIHDDLEWAGVRRCIPVTFTRTAWER